MSNLRILLALLLIVLFPSISSSRPKPDAKNCAEESVTFTLDKDVNTTTGTGAFELVALKGLVTDWDRTTTGGISDCWNFIATQGNLQVQYICADAYYKVDSQIRFRLATASISMMRMTFASHNADVDMNIAHLWPGIGAGCDPCDTNSFTQVTHQATSNAFESLTHSIRYEVTRDRHHSILWFSNTGSNETLTVLTNSFLRFTTDRCTRGIPPA